MTNKPRFVFDTNTVISALLNKNSTPRKAFDKAMEMGKILISIAIIDELNDVLGREKFNKYVSEEERIQFLIVLLQEAVFVEITEAVRECRDPRDDKFLELAINGSAGYIISGDKDLLSLHPFRGIAVVSPKDFLESAELFSP
jgi:putative PIN family toxin of toxin-antitoxin system